LKGIRGARRQGDKVSSEEGLSVLITLNPSSVLRFSYREELAIRHMENVELIEKAKKKYLLARMKVIRLRAEMAFLAAGGTRGAFARQWLWAFLEEVCSADTPNAVSDH